MGKINVIEFQGREGRSDLLTELLRAGAEQLIYQAVEAELHELVEYADTPSSEGRRFRPSVIENKEVDSGLLR